MGIALSSHWFIPYSDATYNVNAASRALDFMLGWWAQLRLWSCSRTLSWLSTLLNFLRFLDPVINGDYPHSMRSLVGNRLPKFSRKQSATLKGSLDFVGLNYYTTNYAHYMIPSSNQPPSYTTDARANLTSKTDIRGIEFQQNFNGVASFCTDFILQICNWTPFAVERNGILIGPQVCTRFNCSVCTCLFNSISSLAWKTKLWMHLQAGSSWLCVYPKGIRKLLLYLKNKYGNPLIYITENGT